MTAIKHVFTTVFFAALSPLYLLYIVVLVILSPLGLVVAKPFHHTNSNHDFSEYADQEVGYSLNEVFTFSGFKRVVSTFFFAVLSPLYLLYIVGLVFIAPLGFLLSRISRLGHKDDSNGMDHNSVVPNSSHA